MISLAGHFQIQTAGGRPRRVLLFAAQFGGAGFRHIPRVGCYSAHIFLFEGRARALGLCGLLESSAHFPAVSSSQGERQLLLLAAQFPGQPFPHMVVIDNTIGCANRLRRPRWLGLLFAAHFKAGRARRLFSGILHAGLLFSAHFLIADVPVFIAIPLIFCFLSAVVIVCTFLRFTAAFPAYPPQQTKKMLGCYPQHNSMYSVFHSVSKLRIRQQPRQIQLGRQNPLRVPLKKILILPVVIQRTFPKS